ncbi:MAG: sulfite exporter TauE/SafE family protein [Actinomycetota bacterium]
MPDALRVALTLAAGVLTGVLSGMFGIGGAVISNPSLRALGASPIESVGSTLPSIIPSALSGALRYRKAGLLRAEVIRWVAPVGAIASIGGALCSDLIPGEGHVLTMSVAVLMGYTAMRTARRPPAVPIAPEADIEMAVPTAGAPHEEPWRLLSIGIAAGTLSGLLGIGGGLFMVPAFSGWLRIPIKETIATSLSCVAIIAVPGMVTHAVQGHIDWSFAIPLAIGVIPGARIGAGLTIGTDERTLRVLVSWALGVIGAIYAVEEFVALISV